MGINPDLYTGLVIFIVVSIFIIISYQFIYPKFAGWNLTRLVFLDLLMIAVSLVVVYLLIWNYSIGWKIPWWFFAIVLGMIIEYPFFIQYCKKYKLC